MPAKPAPKPWIEGIHAYVPGKAKAADGRELVKLSANENPLGTSPAALAALTRAVEQRRTKLSLLLAPVRIAQPVDTLHAAVEAGIGPVFGVIARQGYLAPRKAVYIGAMTATATTPLAPEITDRLTTALSPSHLEVINDSRHHAGHMGDDGTGESHWTVVVESAAFVGLNRVARQRLVNNALADLLSSRIHALSIRARAPGEGHGSV